MTKSAGEAIRDRISQDEMIRELRKENGPDVDIIFFPGGPIMIVAKFKKPKGAFTGEAD